MGINFANKAKLAEKKTSSAQIEFLKKSDF